MSLEAVIFDWGGTLTPWIPVDPAEAWRRYASAYVQAGGAGDVEELAGRLSLEEAQAWRATRDEARAAHLHALLDGHGIALDSDAHRAGELAFRSAWEPHTHTDPAVAGVFEELHRLGLSVGVLSNTVWPTAWHEEIFSRDGVDRLIDGAVYTSQLEVTKPHPEAFRAACRAVGVGDPSRAVFVGDRLFEDVWGPAQVNMRSIFVPHSTIPHDQRGHTEGVPDAVVRSLAEIPTVVAGWL